MATENAIDDARDDATKRADSNFRAKKSRKLQQKRHLKGVTDPVAAFRQHIQEGPVYTCVSCHRNLYRESVFKFNQACYKPACQELLFTMLAAFNGNRADQVYICCMCQSYIRRCQVPP